MAALAVALGGWFLWRETQTRAVLVAALPQRPALAAGSELADGIEACEARVARGPRRMAAMGELSALYHANGFLAEAATCYRGLIRVQPHNPRWPHLLANILGSYGQLDETLPLLQRVVALAPDYLAARLQLADVLLKLDRPGEAAQAYAAVLAQSAGNRFALLGLARCHLEAGDWDQARARLEHAVREEPKFEPAWHLLATVYDRLGQADAALAARARTTGNIPEIPDPWRQSVTDQSYDPYHLTVAAAQAENAGEFDRAATLLRRAVELDPANDDALIQLGKLLASRGDAAGAYSCFQRSVTVAPKNAEGWLSLAILLGARGEPAAAEQTLLRGLAHCPDSPDLHIANGRRLAQAGRLEPAIRSLREAVRLRPQHADAYVELARVLAQAGHTQESLATAHAALRVQPRHPGAMTLLARHAIASGDEEAARRWLREIRQQPKIRPAESSALASAFQQRFGGAP